MIVHSTNARATFDREAFTYGRRSSLATNLMIAVFFCGIFEGAARKWLLPPDIPELSYLAYLSKFLAFGLIGVAIAVSTAPSRCLLEFRGYLQIGLIMLFCGALLSALSDFSFAGGFLTIVMTVVGPVLAYLTTSKIRMADIKLILRWIAVMSLFPAALGAIQFELPATHVLNMYLGDTGWKNVITDLGRVRAVGTFSFISGMAAMTVVCIWSGLSLYTLSTRARDQLLGLMTIGSGFICGLAALSRSAVFLGLALIAIRLIFVGRDPKLLILVVVGALSYGYLSIDRPTTQKELEVTITSGVFTRHSRSDSVLDRLSSWGSQLSDASYDVPLGNGFGINQVGGQAVDTGRRVLVSYEAELARLVTEIGVLGLLGVLAIRIGLLLALFRAWRRMERSPTRDAVLLSVATMSVFFVGNTAFNHVAAGFAWPIAAIALAWASDGESSNRAR